MIETGRELGEGKPRRLAERADARAQRIALKLGSILPKDWFDKPSFRLPGYGKIAPAAIYRGLAPGYG